MSWLKKAARRARRFVKKNVGKIAATAITGAAPVVAGSVLKLATRAAKNVGAGRRVKGAPAPIAPKSVRAQAVKLDLLSPGAIKPISDVVAMTQPGGAPLPRKRPKLAASTVKAARSLGKRRKRRTADMSNTGEWQAPLAGLPGGKKYRAKARAAQKARRKAATGGVRVKRKAPTGGLDLKALSASWKAAGKPGTWQSWIAQNK